MITWHKHMIIWVTGVSKMGCVSGEDEEVGEGSQWERDHRDKIDDEGKKGLEVGKKRQVRGRNIERKRNQEIRLHR